MGQKASKKEPERGSRFYEEQRFEEAIEDWKSIISKKSSVNDKFTLYGQICRSYLDIGNTADALDFAKKQMELANNQNKDIMKSEAFFHLAICNEMISEFSKSIAFCRNSLQIVESENPLEGYLHLCMGNSFVGLSEFRKAWTSYKRAEETFESSRDHQLEILVNTKLGMMFTMLKDFDTGVEYIYKAWNIVSQLKDNDPNIKYRRLVGACLAVPYRNTGKYKDSSDLTEDAMKVAMLYNDIVVQVKCMVLFADIHRSRGDNERSIPRYESALSLLEQIGDRVGQADVLLGMAKAHKNMSDPEQAIQLSTKALDIAKKIGNKLQMLRCHAILKFLYFETRDTTLSSRHHTLVKQLADETDLYCSVCDQLMGKEAETLIVLFCGHFTHARCTISRLHHTCVICERKPNIDVYKTLIDD
ncbi:hypothetical protein LOTGIDRAFT_156505 [Lottia gigantea]|uniref:RING-type domain-containing protein n=1 Tax=Lottia gigantea TaxID=225164 RepID=V4BDT8_LOTGI|nr:hypothetical protein LOTGIDRAFT_156505 [Lottia gigantea]ESP03907.1 hypothetical protein LOTGIDRAFT_156505 [Lottia gigantea]